MNPFKITEHYEQNHQRLDELRLQFEHLQPTDWAAATGAFDQFWFGWERHIDWEEQILFGIFEERSGLHDGGPTAVMRREHREIQCLLATIGQALSRHQVASGPVITELKELLRQHNYKEEHVLYPAIDALLSEAERVQVFADMQLR